jgi:hypothetical protein
VEIRNLPGILGRFFVFYYQVDILRIVNRGENPTGARRAEPEGGGVMREKAAAVSAKNEPPEGSSYCSATDTPFGADLERPAHAPHEYNSANVRFCQALR